MAELLKGKPVADALTARLQEKINEKSLVPTLAIVRVGEKPGDISYEKSIVRQAEKTGVVINSYIYDDSITQPELVKKIEDINFKEKNDGILVLRPLPEHIEDRIVTDILSPNKDMDGATMGSMAGIMMKEKMGYPPCTASACMEILHHYGISLSGKKVTVVGRSLVVGRPVSIMATNEDATVVMCHSKTPPQELKKVCREADILISAVGKANFLDTEHMRAGQVIIDVGINVGADGNLCGDVDFNQAKDLDVKITPVPGGVGSVTTAILMKHVVEAATNFELLRR